MVFSCSICLAGEFGYDLTVKLGPEYDSNSNRVPKITGSASATANVTAAAASPQSGLLIRTMADLSGYCRTQRSITSLAYEGGYKFFLDSANRAANEHVHRLRLESTQGFGKNWELAERVAYFDDFLRISTRDFRLGSAGVELRRWLVLGQSRHSKYAGAQSDKRPDRIPNRIRLLINPTISALQYKPADSFSFVAPGAVLSAGLHHAINDRSNLQLQLSETARYRMFRGDAFCEPGTCDTGRKSSARRDLNSLTQLRLSIDSDALFSVWYGIELNRSTSFGESYRRHIVGLDMTAPLTERFFFSGQAVYQLSAFADTLFGQSVQQLVVPVEQENRSRLVVRLGYDWTDWLSSSVWYSLFVNESAATTQGQAIPGYFRQTLFLGIDLRSSSQ